MIICQAQVQDASAICRISSDDLGYPCSSEFVQKQLQNLDSRREVVFVAEVDDFVAGYIHAQVYNTLYSEPMVNLLGLAVSSAYQRHGIGKTLLGCVENWSKEMHIGVVRLNSAMSRKGAHAFYRKMGYGDEKEQLRFLKSIDI